VRDWLNAMGLFLILSLGLFYFSGFQSYAVAANLLVTIVHVFLFTEAFILFGALKSKSWVGALSLGIFVACAIASVARDAPDRVCVSYQTLMEIGKSIRSGRWWAIGSQRGLSAG
jgi:hypothetical protein